MRCLNCNSKTRKHRIVFSSFEISIRPDPFHFTQFHASTSLSALFSNSQGILFGFLWLDLVTEFAEIAGRLFSIRDHVTGENSLMNTSNYANQVSIKKTTIKNFVIKMGKKIIFFRLRSRNRPLISEPMQPCTRAAWENGERGRSGRRDGSAGRQNKPKHALCV